MNQPKELSLVVRSILQVQRFYACAVQALALLEGGPRPDRGIKSELLTEYAEIEVQLVIDSLSTWGMISSAIVNDAFTWQLSEIGRWEELSDDFPPWLQNRAITAIAKDQPMALSPKEVKDLIQRFK